MIITVFFILLFIASLLAWFGHRTAAYRIFVIHLFGATIFAVLHMMDAVEIIL